MLTGEILEILKQSPRGKVLIITIGNDFRSDDGIGPYIAGRCGKLKSGYILIDAKDKPENIIDKALAVNPDKTIMIDGADFGGAPGEMRIVKKEQIPSSALSTHIFPLNIIAGIIEKETKSTAWFLGIQVKNIEFGEKISAEVLRAAEEISDFICEVK